LKRVLIVTYYWPPNGGSGVQRWLKFAKYLPEFGWEPIIFTPENPLIAQRDESLMRDVAPNLEVLRWPIWDPVAKLQERSGNPNVGLLQKEKSATWKTKVITWLRGNLLIPDPKIFWVRPAVKYLTAYLQAHPVDVVVTTGPPHSMHLIGLRLQQQLGVKWVADFRDPWTRIDFFKDLMPSYIARRLHHKMEKNVVQATDLVLGVSQEICDDYQSLGAKNIQKLTNGFDPGDYEALPENPESGFTISHIGNLVPSRNPVQLWRGLRWALEAQPELEAHLKLRFVGNVDVSVKEHLKEFQLDHLATFVTYVPHKEVVKEQAKSRILLLLVNNTPNAGGILTGKLFEYMAAKRFILAIGPRDGELERVLQDTQSGSVLDFEDAAGIKTLVLEEFQSFKEGAPMYRPNFADKYSRKELTKKLTQLLDGIQ